MFVTNFTRDCFHMCCTWYYIKNIQTSCFQYPVYRYVYPHKREYNWLTLSFETAWYFCTCRNKKTCFIYPIYTLYIIYPKFFIYSTVIYYPTTPADGKYRESIWEVNIFFILHSRISSINTRESCFSKYYISVVISKLKLFVVTYYRQIIHLFEA